MVLVGALFVGSMATVWHGDITPRSPRSAHNYRWMIARATALQRRRKWALQHGIDGDPADAAGLRRLAARSCSRVAAFAWDEALATNPMSDWRPTATRETLQRRARMLAHARRFFADRQVIEVDTPLVVNAPVTDVHIHSAQSPSRNARALLPAHLPRIRHEAPAGRRQRRHLPDLPRGRGDSSAGAAQLRVHAHRVVSHRDFPCPS